MSKPSEGTIFQKNHQSFHPSQPFNYIHFTMIHPVGGPRYPALCYFCCWIVLEWLKTSKKLLPRGFQVLLLISLYVFDLAKYLFQGNFFGSEGFVLPCRDCISTGAAGEQTRRFLWHYILHPQIWAFSTMYWNPQSLRPGALFYRTDCTCRSKFLTHALT